MGAITKRHGKKNIRNKSFKMVSRKMLQKRLKTAFESNHSFYQRHFSGIIL